MTEKPEGERHSPDELADQSGEPLSEWELTSPNPDGFVHLEPELPVPLTPDGPPEEEGEIDW